jgi:integrase
MKLPPGCQCFIDHTGAPRTYYRHARPRAPLPGLPYSAEFMAAYEAARASVSREPIVIGASRTKPGTLNAAFVKYYASEDFTLLQKATQGPQRSLLERWRADRGDRPMRELRQEHLQGFINKLGSPSVQRNMIRALRHFCKFAKRAMLIDHNPAADLERAKMAKTGGFYTWSEDDVSKYEAKHPVGSKARLALALYLNLGVRKSDVVRIGPGHIRGGILHNFLPQKGSHNDGHRISIKLFDETKEAIAATPVTGTATYLVTSFGKAFTANGFGNKMREWCDEAGLPDCTSHGLRKLMMIRLAHAGYTAPQIAAISGHKDLREVQTYIERMNRERMAIETSTAFEQDRKANRGLSN